MFQKFSNFSLLEKFEVLNLSPPLPLLPVIYY